MDGFEIKLPDIENINEELLGKTGKAFDGIEEVGLGEKKEEVEEREEIRIPEVSSGDSDGDDGGDIDYADVLSKSVEEHITEHNVKMVRINDVDTIELPAYIIDMSDMGPVMPATLMGLKTMLRGGDTAVYIKTANGVRKVGSGDAIELYDELATYIRAVYKGECKLLKDYDGVFKQVKLVDVNSLVLDM